MEEKAFVRDHFAEAVHGLACVAASDEEAALISHLITSQEARATQSHKHNMR